MAGRRSGLARLVTTLGLTYPEVVAGLPLDFAGQGHAELQTLQQPLLDIIGDQVAGGLVIASLEEILSLPFNRVAFGDIVVSQSGKE